MIKDIRIGQGYDVHAFAERRKLILGGIEVAHERGLLGHSDADVLLHAVTDAILGALSWGDIGKWFPDTSEEFRGADSANLLTEVWNKARAEGWSIGNCDCTILAQRPKLAPYIDQMRGRIGALLGTEVERVSVKATTTEKLGFVGREEGITALAVVILQKN